MLPRLLGLLLVFVASATAVLAPLSPARVDAAEGPDPFFGAVQALNNPDRAAEAGVQWERIIFPWVLIQPNGPESWTNGYFTDDQIHQEIQRGRTVIGIAIYTPEWASSDQDHPVATSVPEGLYLPYDDPNNHWGSFMYKLAARYQGQIDTWVLWNEPDQYNAEVRNTWEGSIGDFYQLQKVGYLAVKRANPNAVVALPGFTYFWDKENGRQQYLQSLLDLARQDPTASANNSYFDLVDVHVYGNPLNAYTIPQIYRRVLAQYGLKKPIWIIESNTVPFDDPASEVPPIPFRSSMDQQASYMVEAFALGRAAGIDRMSVYKMVDEFAEGQGDLYGLVRNDGSTRPAFRAYQTAVKYLSHPTSAVYTWEGAAEPPTDDQITRLLESNANRHQFPWPAAINMVALEEGAQRVTVVWNASPNPATGHVPAAAGSARLIDKFGTDRGEIVASNGQYMLDLMPSTNNTDPREPCSYLVGGDPMLIVEQVAPLPLAVDAPIQIVWPHDGAPIAAAGQANVSALLLAAGSSDPVPCRWNRRVQLMVSANGGPAQPLGLGGKRLVTENGVTYLAWYFDNVDVAAAQQGSTLEFWIAVDGVQVASAPRWPYGMSAPQPLAWQNRPTRSCQ